MSAPLLPGRLGVPDRTLRDDPRADPRMIAMLDEYGAAGQAEPPPLGHDAPLADILAHIDGVEEAFEALFAMTADARPAVPGVDQSIEVIRGVDGNDITLHIHRPTGQSAQLPGVLHLHGGGMVQLSAAGPAYARWRDSLAATQMVVVGVEFRNGAGKLGPHPFPAGLDDCVAGLRWLLDNRGELGVDKVIVSGESGGGNLTLATTLRAKRDGLADRIDGVYAMCPFISGQWASPPPELASLVENGGYFLDVAAMAVFARPYDPTGDHIDNPLAWPLRAGPDDLAGLPPHVISVNELDPLRDEGLAYAVKLARAGVPVVSRTVNGTCHAGDMICAGAFPEVEAATLRDIHGFATSL